MNSNAIRKLFIYEIILINEVIFQKALNLPTKTPSERRIENEAKREQKQKQDLKKKESKITLPSILAAVKPAIMKRDRSNNQLTVPVHSLNSMVCQFFLLELYYFIHS